MKTEQPVPSVPRDLLDAFMAAYGDVLGDPLRGLMKEGVDLSKEVGRMAGVREVFVWLNRLYEKQHGRPYHVLRTGPPQTHTDPSASSAPGAYGREGSSAHIE